MPALPQPLRRCSAKNEAVFIIQVRRLVQVFGRYVERTSKIHLVPVRVVLADAEDRRTWKSALRSGC